MTIVDPIYSHSPDEDPVLGLPSEEHEDKFFGNIPFALLLLCFNRTWGVAKTKVNFEFSEHSKEWLSDFF